MGLVIAENRNVITVFARSRCGKTIEQECVQSARFANVFFVCTDLVLPLVAASCVLPLADHFLSGRSASSVLYMRCLSPDACSG